jgi:hypothetical protein
MRIEARRFDAMKCSKVCLPPVAEINVDSLSAASRSRSLAGFVYEAQSDVNVTLSAHIPTFRVQQFSGRSMKRLLFDS